MKSIKITNPDKVLFPGDDITKMDVVQYYVDVSNEMLKFATNRVLSAIRCHENILGELFFKKHPQTEQYVKTTQISDAEYFYITDLLGLVEQVQNGTLEFHTSPHPVSNESQTSIMVFDLDPDENLPLKKLQESTLLIKNLLDELGLESFVKTSGGKGYHILVPFKAVKNQDKFYEFSKNIAELAKQNWPNVFTTNIKKVERKNKIFVDYLRNNKTSSCACVYSIRAKKSAPVSFPISWENLKKIKPNEITIKNYKKYINNSWQNFFKLNQKIK